MTEIEQLITSMGLLPHPEGGFYKETYRSAATVKDGSRNLATAIYFLLTSKDVSRFHRIKSDELWFHHAGSPLIVHVLDEQGHHQNLIGNLPEAGIYPQFLVPKDTVFGSSVVEADSYALVSCVVAPGFDFADFELFSTDKLLEMYPGNDAIIRKLS